MSEQKIKPEPRSKKHQTLLNAFFRAHHSEWGSYQDHAKILWIGEHHVLIRTGMGAERSEERGSRDVFLADKVGLLGDEDASPLHQLALHAHPAQIEANAELLHTSWKVAQVDQETPFTGRWCKSKLAEAIAYAKTQDARYEEEILPTLIEDHEAEELRSKEQEKAEELRTKLMLKALRKLGVYQETDYRAGILDYAYESKFLTVSCEESWDSEADPTIRAQISFEKLSINEFEQVILAFQLFQKQFEDYEVAE